jgi:predicted acylesterase/phospholipase RssA
MLALSPGSVEAKKNKKQEKAAKKHSNVHDLEKRDISPEQLEAMRVEYVKTVAAERNRMLNTALRRVEREYKAHLETGAPFVRDILIISGGGAKGAFGAGFLQGWETVTGATALPVFDVVTGVSTGALIAPFAFIGTEEAYTAVADFYANPGENWVHKRGLLYIKPSHVSLFNDDVLQEMIRNSVDDALVEAMAAGAAEDRMLQIGATNLDLGIGRVFDMGHEATEALDSGSRDRIHSILLASSAIPSVFPPVVIDDLWYGDGGATVNITLFVSPGFNATWRALHPEAPMPKYRIWIVVNQQVRPEPAVTMPSWVSVAGRGLNTMTQSLQLFAMHLLHEIVKDYQETEGMDVEFRWVAIPEDAPKPATTAMFDKDYMLALEELGREMGADPSIWKTDVPLVYSFGN